ncbi:MAG TPA: hypothetical protein VGI96_17735 [Streptosporangiaceae bacterium]|jgi:hypothetical protein
MSMLKRSTGFAAVAGLAVLAGCGGVPAGSPGPARTAVTASSAPAGSTPASSTARLDDASRACAGPGSYLTAVRTGKHGGYDRVVFQFSGGLPAVTTERVATVYADPRGTPVSLAGKSRLHVVFRGASANCPQPAHRTWTGPSVLTPRYPQLLMIRAAGDFEGYLSFGIGLAARGGYHVSRLAGPDRVVIDFTRSRIR